MHHIDGDSSDGKERVNVQVFALRDQSKSRRHALSFRCRFFR